MDASSTSGSTSGPARRLLRLFKLPSPERLSTTKAWAKGRCTDGSWKNGLKAQISLAIASTGQEL
jgi:hypothetical protein